MCDLSVLEYKFLHLYIIHELLVDMPLYWWCFTVPQCLLFNLWTSCYGKKWGTVLSPWLFNWLQTGFRIHLFLDSCWILISHLWHCEVANIAEQDFSLPLLHQRSKRYLTTPCFQVLASPAFYEESVECHATITGVGFSKDQWKYDCFGVF